MTNMIKFDFQRFLYETEISIPELAARLKMTRKGVDAMVERGTIKPGIITLLKKKFGKKYVDKYKIINHNVKQEEQ